MVEKQSYLKIFITQFNNFIDDMILLCPEDNDFKVFKNGVSLLNRTNPRKILVLFDEYIEKYKDKISERQKEKINCPICNKIVSRCNIAKHKKSKNCLSYKTI